MKSGFISFAPKQYERLSGLRIKPRAFPYLEYERGAFAEQKQLIQNGTK